MTKVVERRVHVYVTGIVQGVWYRANTQRTAEELGLQGWVQNLPDGRVEFVAEGTESEIEALLRWARRGPPDARVDDLRVLDEDPTHREPAFEIRR